MHLVVAETDSCQKQAARSACRRRQGRLGRLGKQASQLEVPELHPSVFLEIHPDKHSSFCVVRLQMEGKGMQRGRGWHFI